MANRLDHGALAVVWINFGLLGIAAQKMDTARDADDHQQHGQDVRENRQRFARTAFAATERLNGDRRREHERFLGNRLDHPFWHVIRHASKEFRRSGQKIVAMKPRVEPDGIGRQAGCDVGHSVLIIPI